MKVNAKIQIDKELTIDCLGCDHCKDVIETLARKRLFGLYYEKLDQQTKYYCSKLSRLPLSGMTINNEGMTPNECPCKFEHWSQTNRDYELTDTMFTLTFKDGNVTAKPVVKQEKIDA